MEWKALVYSDKEKSFEFTTATKKSLFEMCQAYCGHCLGKIKNKQGDPIGWRFAKCEEKSECIPTVYEIMIEEI